MNVKRFFRSILGTSERKPPHAYKTDHHEMFERMRDLKYEMEMAEAVRIGAGSGGIVYAYPSTADPDLIVRLSKSDATGADGWVQYAETLRQNWEPGTPHYGPMLLDIVHEDGLWMSVTPRLSPVDTDNSHQIALINAARKIIDPDRWGEPSPKDQAFLEKHQPGFAAFASAHLGNASDLGHSNFMMDGDRLIVNDPIGSMDPQFEAEIREKYDVSNRSHVAELS